MAVGHLPHNESAQHVYLSRHMTIDIQGLVMTGRESRSLIVAHGVRRVPAGSLMRPSKQRSSHLAVAQTVESSPILQELCHRAENADNAYKAALASGSATEQNLTQLAAENKATLDRLFNIRRRILAAELDRLVLEDVERGELRALVGAGPSQAIQELRDELAEHMEEEDAEWNAEDDVEAPSDTGAIIEAHAADRLATAPQHDRVQDGQGPQLSQHLRRLLDEIREESNELADELGSLVVQPREELRHRNGGWAAKTYLHSALWAVSRASHPLPHLRERRKQLRLPRASPLRTRAQLLWRYERSDYRSLAGRIWAILWGHLREQK